MTILDADQDASPTGDGLISTIRAKTLADRKGVEAERKRLERLVTRHQESIAALPFIGSREFLEKVGVLLADRMNEKHGAELVHEVSGPFGMAPDWYLSLRTTDKACWSIVKLVGGLEGLRIKGEEERGPGTPMPEDVSELLSIFEKKHEGIDLPADEEGHG
jgi:hypothetical protein